MMDAILVEMLREIPRQMADAVPVVLAFAKANPLIATLIVAALMFGGPSGRRTAASRG